MRRLLLLLSCLTLVRGTGTSQWTQTAGPEGGTVPLLAVNQSTGHVFAGTKGGIYRSDNGGATWTWVNSGLPSSYSVTALHSVGINTYAYGATSQSTWAMYWSTNEGGSWTLMASTGLPTLPSITCFLTSGAALLAGVSGPLGGSGVYRSTDNGGSWTLSSSGLPSTFYPGAFGVSGSNIFAGGHINATTKGVYLSTDGGGNWTAVNTNIPTTAGVTAFERIGSTVFASTLTGGVFRTTDNGANWTKISPTSPVLLVGATALAATATNLYIGFGGVVYGADATGSGWDTLTTGLPPHDAGSSTGALAITGTNMLASCSNLGIWRTTNGGAAWTRSNAGLRNANIWGLLTDGSALYASGVTTGFFRSATNGDSWTEINTGVNLLNNGYYGLASIGGALVGGSGIGAYRSTNQGNSWVPPSLDVTGPFYAVVVDGTDLYASGQGFVAKSSNGGVNWTSLPTGFLAQQAVFALLKNGQIMLTATSSGGIKRSTDGGATWTAPISGLPTFGAFSSLALIGSNYFITHGGGVYRSTNDGANWTLANTGVVGAPSALHARGTDLFVGTVVGVYRSNNLGASWTALNTGLPSTPIITVLTSNSQYLFAGLNPASVWRRPLSEVTEIELGAAEIPSVFSLEQNYPNPFNPSTTIRYGLPERTRAALTIFNSLGQEVTTLFQGEADAGYHEVQLNAAGLPSGVYFYRLQGEGFVQTRKLILMK